MFVVVGVLFDSDAKWFPFVMQLTTVYLIFQVCFTVETLNFDLEHGYRMGCVHQSVIKHFFLPFNLKFIFNTVLVSAVWRTSFTHQLWFSEFTRPWNDYFCQSENILSIFIKTFYLRFAIVFPLKLVMFLDDELILLRFQWPGDVVMATCATITS